jgi:uncharacterized membrane protein
MKSPLQVVFLALVVTALVQSFWQHDRLPEKVAAHFNGSGQADGWMSRGARTAWHVVTVLFLAAVFQGITTLLSRLPKEYVNIPHRDYWLAPERAAATHARVRTSLLLIGCSVMIFFIVLFHLSYRANLNPPPRLGSSVGWLTGGLLAVVVAGTATLLARFGRKPSA